ncbi:hypothetical protein BOSEA31B_20125 [Hyphomicrobiales bacterium]|jgi:hypothetical protein|nr:hypothetical protein BOSEA31B_20125 [Hyphomicrobiales bacterium]CAH1702503.1 hypothetical protein BOSEA1005_30375 [Hyphomicrobiales bacterium]CAI0346704.1 hypothetical protein BO1005MUT1_520216 [Hyphomicrobiales bacterium]
MKFALFLIALCIFDASVGTWLLMHRPDAILAWGPPIGCGVIAGAVGALSLWKASSCFGRQSEVSNAG